MRRRQFGKTVAGGIAAASLLGGSASADPLEEIEILTDEYNESHIYADSLYLLGYGNGYVQARDRLFQIDVIRHIGRGDSAKLLGPGQIPSDIQVRRDLYSPEQTQQQWEQAADTAREMVKGYTDGVNRKMTEMAAQGELPGIFAALGHAPEPWEPTDTLACINYLIGVFGVSGGSEIGNAKTLGQMADAFTGRGGEAAAWDAYGDLNWLETTDDHYTTIPPQDKVVPGEEQNKPYDEVPEAQLEVTRAAEGAIPWGIEEDLSLPGDTEMPEDFAETPREALGVMEGFKWGSNAVVVAPEKTKTGRPLLGGGPQMANFKPPIPYEIGLHGAGFDVSGMGVPGAPSLVIGRTENLAWTVTSGRDDMIDTVAVELDSDDRHRYRWDGDWHEMTTKTVTHEASPVLPATGGDPKTRVVEQEVAYVEQDGATMPVVAWNPEENVAFCQRRTTYLQELDGAFQWVEVGRADDLDDFEDKLSEFPFTFNFHIIDDEGNIAYIHTGKVPDRNPEVDSRFPQPSDLHRWTRIRSGVGLGTTHRNPSTGYYTNWNNGPAAKWRAGDSEQNWGSQHRVEVLNHFIQERLAETNDELTLQDVRDIIELAAKHDATANAEVPAMVRLARGTSDEQIRAMAAELDAWADEYCPWNDGGGVLGDEGFNGDASASERDTYVDAGLVIYEEVRRELQRLIFDDELGPRNYEPDWAPDASRHADEHGNATDDVTFIDVLTGNTESDHDWFIDLDTGEERSPKEVVLEAFAAAAETLEERFASRDPATWLREEHKTVFTVLGAVQGEAIDMVNRSTYQHAVEMGAGLEGSMDALPPSNSGHVTAPELARFLAGVSDEPERVDDQLELYANFEYKPHPVTREQVESVAVTSQTLRATSERPDVPAAASRYTPNVLLQELLTTSDQARDLVGAGVESD